MQKATRLAKDNLAPEERQALRPPSYSTRPSRCISCRISFSAGHVAGSWGNPSQRKGTHDLYNEAGLEVFLWLADKQSMVLMGDAHMRPEDAERAAVAIRTSLEQVLDTAAGLSRPTDMPYTPAAPIEFDPFDVCKNDTMVARPEGLRAPPQEAHRLGAEVLRPTPYARPGARARRDAAVP